MISVMRPLQIVVVVGNDLMRSGLQRLLQQISPAYDVQAFRSLAQLQPTQPDSTTQRIIILDDAPSAQEPIQRVVRGLQRQDPKAFVVVLTDRTTEAYVQSVLDAGAVGLLYKQGPVEILLPSVLRVILAGQTYLSPQLAILPYRQPQHSALNRTDLEVLRLIEAGCTVQEIALRVQIVERSVYRIRRKLRDTLGVRTNEQIVDAARQQGVLDDKRTTSSATQPTHDTTGKGPV